MCLFHFSPGDTSAEPLIRFHLRASPLIYIRFRAQK